MTKKICIKKAMEFYLKAANKGNVLAAAIVKNKIKKFLVSSH